MKPIFEPGDLLGMYDLSGIDAQVAFLNAKLASLGIDAGTPETIRMLAQEARIAASRALEYERMLAKAPIDAGTPEKVKLHQRRIDVMQKTMAEMKQRLSELERLLAEAPTVYGNPNVPNSWGLSRCGWTDKPMTHTAKLVGVKELGK